MLIRHFFEGTKNTVGEFFNPGYDCADILNKRQDSQDGFYWINLQGKNLRKVKKMITCASRTVASGLFSLNSG